MAITCTINQSIKEIEWTFSDGSVVLHCERVSPEILAYAAFHGLKQRGTDTMALKADDFGGRVPEAAKRAELQAMVAHLESGTAEWNRRSATGEPRGGLLLTVLCEAYPGQTREKLATWLKGKSAADRAALLREPRMAVIAERIREAAGKGADTQSLVDELESL